MWEAILSEIRGLQLLPDILLGISEMSYFHEPLDLHCRSTTYQSYITLTPNYFVYLICCRFRVCSNMIKKITTKTKDSKK